MNVSFGRSQSSCMAKMLRIYHERCSAPGCELAGHVCIAHFLLQSKLMCWPFNYTTNKQTAEKLFTSYSTRSRRRKKFIDYSKGSAAAAAATGNCSNCV